MDILKIFDRNVIQVLKTEIENASGNEVFFVGQIDKNGIVTDVHAGARGNNQTVVVNKTLKKTASVLIHNHPGGNLTPSKADLQVASECSENAQGFYIINNEVSDVYVVVEPVKPKVIKKISVDDAAFYISKRGPLSRISKTFEERTVQIELLKNMQELLMSRKLQFLRLELE